jgi:hypothetical protein
MPYSINKVSGGFLVCTKEKCFSKKPLTKKKAQKERVAIAISESKKTGQSIGNFFI